MTLCIKVSTPLKSAPLNLQTVTAPLFRQSPLYIGFSWTLLKVTKFLVKICQFEFLVMTEKNIFVYNFFCH